MMNSGEQKKRQSYHIDLAGLAVCAILALVGYIAGLRPLVQRHASMATQEARLSAQRSDSVKLAASVGLLESRLSRVKQALADSPVQLKAAYHINRRIARVAGVAAECGMKIDEIHPGKATTTPRYKKVPIRLVSTGSFPMCADLLQRLKEAFPDTTVVSFELVGSPRKPATPARLEINLVWYAAAGPPPAGGNKNNPKEFARAESVSST